jgi:hypothetical protein
VSRVHQIGFDLKVLGQELNGVSFVGVNSTNFCGCDYDCAWLFVGEVFKDRVSVQQIQLGSRLSYPSVFAIGFDSSNNRRAD